MLGMLGKIAIRRSSAIPMLCLFIHPTMSINRKKQFTRFICYWSLSRQDVESKYKQRGITEQPQTNGFFRVVLQLFCFQIHQRKQPLILVAAARNVTLWMLWFGLLSSASHLCCSGGKGLAVGSHDDLFFIFQSGGRSTTIWAYTPSV